MNGGNRLSNNRERSILGEEIELFPRLYSCRNLLGRLCVCENYSITSRDMLGISFTSPPGKGLEKTQVHVLGLITSLLRKNTEPQRSSLRVVVHAVKVYTRVLSLSTTTNATLLCSYQEHKGRKYFSREKLDCCSTFFLCSKTTMGIPCFTFQLEVLNKTIRSALGLVGLLNIATTCISFSVECNTLQRASRASSRDVMVSLTCHSLHATGLLQWMLQVHVC